MELKRLASTTIFLILLMFVPTDANSWQFIEGDIRSPALPSKQAMRLIAFVTLTIDGQIAGGMAVYDNVTTKISADYAEIYNPTGDLLAIVWLDRLGILRSAVDRGIVQNKHALKGVFVLVLAGELA